MLDNFTIQKLRDLPIEGVAERLGLTVTKHKSLCPFHDDSHPSLMFNTRKNTFRCYVCGTHGTTIDLVMKHLHKPFFDACRWLADESNVVLETWKPIHKPYTINPQPSIDVRHLARLVCQPYLNDEAKAFLLAERHISEQVVKQLGLSSISSPVPMSGDLNGPWFNAPSLLIPYRDIDGNLLSVQARYLGPKVENVEQSTIPKPYTLNPTPSYTSPRFQFPRGSRCTIFNLPLLKTLLPGEELWITEGVSDCLAMLSSGRKAIAIPSATLLKASDSDLLRGLNLHIVPDNDRPGEQLFLDLKELLETHSTLNPTPSTLIRHQLPDGYKDFGQYWSTTQDVTTLPC